jgi:hypothetical protein
MLGLTSRATHVDVQVYNTTTSAWVSLRSLLGQNFIRTVSWTDDIDNHGATATIVLDRNQYFKNLANLVQTFQVWGTYGILIDLNIPIKIFAAVVPQGMTPAAADWMEVFYGRIYSTDWATNEMQLQCRDWMDQLQSLWIEHSYGVIDAAPSGQSSQSIMQALLNVVAAYTGAGLVLTTVYSVNGTVITPFLTGSAPDDPGWAIASTDPYPTSLMTVFTSLDNINQQIGWCLRQKFNSNINGWALTWYDPLRTNVTPAWTFPQSFIKTVSTCGLHIGDIRNVMQLWYYDFDNNALATAVQGQDSASITKYGRQFMQIGADTTKGITGNTLASGLTDFQTMLNSALSDLSQPNIDYVVEVPLFYPVELNDIYTFSADNYHFSADQTLACIGYTHTIDKGQGITSLQMRGKPSSGISRWFNRQQLSFTKQLGVVNMNTNTTTSDLHPNSNLGQYSRF